MQGKKSSFAQEAYKGNFIAAGFIKDHDLVNDLSDKMRDFNNKFIPIFLAQNFGKTKIAAGLACGMLWTIVKYLQIGDVVLCPDGKGSNYVGEVSGDYEYQAGVDHPHRRAVRWLPKKISREEMSEPLRNSTGSIGTVSDITKYANEIEVLLSGSRPQTITAVEEAAEDPNVFALEKHLEDFLVENWNSTEFGKKYDIYEEDGEMVGQQYPSDTGRIDILAISKDKKVLLVVELKLGRIGDVAVGQVQRYMGYVKDELAEDGQVVRGVIIASEDDIRLRRALSVAKDIDFYTYKISFSLEKK